MHLISGKNFNFNHLKHVFFDFDGVFTDNSVFVDVLGNEIIKSSRAEGFGLKALLNSGVTCSIVSTETNSVAKARAKKLQIDLTLNVNNKAFFIEDWCVNNGISLKETAFVGNDVNDADAMKLVGVAFCPSDAWPPALSATDFVGTKAGGEGVVREICDFIVSERKKDD